MMTAGEIENLLYKLVKESKLCDSLSGDVYFSGYRPINGTKEDIVITFSAGIPGQIHEGIVKFNIYIPDISVYGDGTLKRNKARTDEVERLSQEWVESIELKDKFLFRLERTIETFEEPEIKQHFINITLKYKIFEL